MKNPIYAITLILAGTISMTGTSFAEHPEVSPHLGTPIHDDSAFRTITIDSKTRTVNVMEDQKIKFVVKTKQGEQQFSWKFDTWKPTINLSEIAPAGILDGRQIKANVEPDLDGVGRIMR